MRPPTCETLRIRNGVARLIRRTTWKCGRLEKSIVKFLMRKPLPEAPVDEIINYVLEVCRHYGPTKGAIMKRIVKSLKRLEERRILKIS